MEHMTLEELESLHDAFGLIVSINDGKIIDYTYEES